MYVYICMCTHARRHTHTHTHTRTGESNRAAMDRFVGESQVAKSVKRDLEIDL